MPNELRPCGERTRIGSPERLGTVTRRRGIWFAVVLLTFGCGDDAAPTAPTVPEELIGTWYDAASEGELTFREDWTYQWQAAEGGCSFSAAPSFEEGRFLVEGDAVRTFVTEIGELGLLCTRDVEAPVLRGAIKYSVASRPAGGEVLLLEFLNAPIDLPVNRTVELERRR